MDRYTLPQQVADTLTGFGARAVSVWRSNVLDLLVCEVRDAMHTRGHTAGFPVRPSAKANHTGFTSGCIIKLLLTK